MKKLLTVLTLAVFAALQSQAAPTFFSSEAAFLTALTGKPSFNETFASIAGGGTRLNTNNLVFSNATFSFTANIPGNPAEKSFWGDTFGTTRALSVGDPSDVFVITNISPNTAAFGGYFFPTYFDDPDVVVDSTGEMTITLLFANATTDGVTNVSRSSTNLNDWFFGWITEEPGMAIRSVTMTAGINNSSAADVTLAVPEPSTYALLTLAAAGMAGYVLRRRRKS